MTALVDMLANTLAPLGVPRALEVATEMLAELSDLELAALAADFEGTWARPSQLFPSTPWRSRGFCTSRRFGKTRACAEFIQREVAAGRATRIGFMAQNYERTIEVMVEGDAGLLATATPWLPARFETGKVIWSNGAEAAPFTPETPDTIRGPGVQLLWASELQSWSPSTREESWHNAQLMCTLGYARTIFDCTPKRRNPLIRKLLQRAARSPELHIISRGVIEENAANLGEGIIAELRADLTGTQRGREELDGEYRDDDDDSVFKAEWFEQTRRGMPTAFRRRIIVVDPAITADARHSDNTGIVCMGLGLDEQVMVTGDLSGVHRPEVWPALVVERYVRDGCDCLVIETNRGGTTHVALLRVACRERGLNLVELGPLERPGARPGTVFVRAINARRSKVERAQAAASLAARGRVSFVNGSNTAELEDALCTFTGAGRGSDDAVDCFTHGCVELADLDRSKISNPTADVQAAAAIGKQLQHMNAPSDPLARYRSTFDPRRTDSGRGRGI